MMNIKITKNIEESNCITHGGKFHCDEVFATVIISKLLDEVKLYRIQDMSKLTDLENLLSEKYVYDIGGGELDHHQPGGNGVRTNGVPFSSTGLVWRKFGHEILEKYNLEDVEYAYELVDRDLIQGIDAYDNGLIPKLNIKYRIMHITKIIGSFNANWDEDVDSDDCFMEALKLAKVVFDNVIKNTISKVKAKSKVDKAIKDSSEGIMYLEKFVPWKEFVVESNIEKAKEINFVVFPSDRRRL